MTPEQLADELELWSERIHNGTVTSRLKAERDFSATFRVHGKEWIAIVRLASKAGRPRDFVWALKVAEDAMARYKNDHLKWWKRMDGTPILNDLCVRMAEDFLSALKDQS